MLRNQIKDYLVESQLFLNRAIVAGPFVMLCLFFLLLQLTNLQITSHEHYTTLSRDNRVKLVPLPPVRGLIYDRNGVIVAQNQPTYSLEVTPEQVQDMDRTLEELSGLIEINDDQLKRFNRLKQQRRRFESLPQKISLTPEEVAIIAVNRHRFPGVDIEAKLLRHYPLADQTAHVLGYVGRINQKELETIDNSAYAGTTHIGKNGVEKFYEDLNHVKGLRNFTLHHYPIISYLYASKIDNGNKHKEKDGEERLLSETMESLANFITKKTADSFIKKSEKIINKYE